MYVLDQPVRFEKRTKVGTNCRFYSRKKFMRILEKKGYTYRRKQIFLSTDAPPKTLIFSQDPVPSPPLTATSYTTNNAAPDITSTITFDASANTLAQKPACTSTSAPSTAQAHTAHDAAPGSDNRISEADTTKGHRMVAPKRLRGQVSRRRSNAPTKTARKSWFEGDEHQHWLR